MNQILLCLQSQLQALMLMLLDLLCSPVMSMLCRRSPWPALLVADEQAVSPLLLAGILNFMWMKVDSVGGYAFGKVSCNLFTCNPVVFVSTKGFFQLFSRLLSTTVLWFTATWLWQKCVLQVLVKMTVAFTKHKDGSSCFIWQPNMACGTQYMWRKKWLTFLFYMYM